MANTVRAAFSARFRKALEEAGYAGRRQNELARLFGVSAQAVRKWLQGDAMPSSTRAAQVASVLGVRRAWLMDGEDPMRVVSMQVTEGSPGAYSDSGKRKGTVLPPASVSLSSEEYRLLTRYRRLPRELQESLENMLDSLDAVLPTPDEKH